VVDLQVEGYGNVNIFTYDELSAATKNFRPDQILGEGGFGVVYKGVIDENVRAGFPSRQVAVKELNPEGFQGDKEWLVSLIALLLFLNFTLVMYIEKFILISYPCEIFMIADRIFEDLLSDNIILVICIDSHFPCLAFKK
jgi:hypothetical protein